MKANVTYNGDGSITQITVEDKDQFEARFSFDRDSSIASLTAVEPAKGQTAVYGDRIDSAMTFLKELDFVNGVDIDTAGKE